MKKVLSVLFCLVLLATTMSTFAFADNSSINPRVNLCNCGGQIRPQTLYSFSNKLNVCPRWIKYDHHYLYTWSAEVCKSCGVEHSRHKTNTQIYCQADMAVSNHGN